VSAQHPGRSPLAAPSSERTSIEVPVPEWLVEEVARRAAALVEDRQRAPEPWIGVGAAAEHLACPRSRIYALTSRRGPGQLPHRKDGSRLLFRASELDGWLQRGGGTRP